MSENNTAQTGWQHKGISIKISDRGTFHVQGGVDFDLNFHESSLQAAKDRIDKRLQVKAAQERRRLKINALTKDNKQVVLTGVHARNSELLTTPKLESSDFPLYFETTVSKLLIKNLADVRQQEKDLEAQLERHRITTSWGWGMIHDEKIDDIEKQARALGVIA